MCKSFLLALASAGVVVVFSGRAASFADQVVDYTPGSLPGASRGFTNASAALGEPSRTTPGQFGGPVDPFNPPYLNNQLVSIGAGGSLTVQFQEPVSNDPTHPFGLDFIVFGSAGFTITNGDFSGGGLTDGSLFAQNAGSTRVSVSPDNTTYYPLNSVLAPVFDGYYPTDGNGDFSLPVNPARAGADFAGRNLSGIRGWYAGSGGGTGYDLAWAQDDQGRPVPLTSIRYVRLEVFSGHSEVDGFAAVTAVPEPSVYRLAVLGTSVVMGFARMRRWRRLLLCLSGFVMVGRVEAATWREDFGSDPLRRDWTVFGNGSLFRWNESRGSLEVTWDSAQTNSYFEKSLGTVLAKDDDFELQFDLKLNDVAVGVTSGKPFAFEIAMGFFNRRQAQSPGFLRGLGTQSPNLVEFDYFPDSGFGATVWPVLVASNSVFNYNGDADYALLELPTNAWLQVTLSYRASNQTMVTTIRRGGSPIETIGPVPLTAKFADFRVDTFAISSYSDAGAEGSLLAHGEIDNVIIQVPEPPIVGLVGQMDQGQWQVDFTGRSHWTYVMQSTPDFNTWTDAARDVSTQAGRMVIRDVNAPAAKAFYRVRAERP